VDSTQRILALPGIHIRLDEQLEEPRLHIIEVYGQRLDVPSPDAWAELIVVAADGIGHGKGGRQGANHSHTAWYGEDLQRSRTFLQAETATNKSVLR
jgi:hypothetical protein